MHTLQGCDPILLGNWALLPSDKLPTDQTRRDRNVWRRVENLIFLESIYVVLFVFVFFCSPQLPALAIHDTYILDALVCKVEITYTLASCNDYLPLFVLISHFQPLEACSVLKGNQGLSPRKTTKWSSTQSSTEDEGAAKVRSDAGAFPANKCVTF